MSEKQSKDLRKRMLNYSKECIEKKLSSCMNDDKEGRRVLLSLIRQGKLPESVCPKR